MKAKLAGQAAATGKSEKTAVAPSTKDGQRQDFGEKNATVDKGEKKGVESTAKGDKAKQKKEKEATGIIKKKKNK